MLFSLITGASCFLAGFLWNRLDLSWPMLPVLAAGFYLGLTVAAFLFLVFLCAHSGDSGVVKSFVVA